MKLGQAEYVLQQYALETQRIAQEHANQQAIAQQHKERLDSLLAPFITQQEQLDVPNLLNWLQPLLQEH